MSIEWASARAASRSASARSARSRHVPSASPDARHPPVPLLRDADVRVDPLLGVGQHLQRPVVDRLEVGGHDLAARLAHLEAEVEVVAVEGAEVLVEAQVAHDPRREDEHEAVERLDLAGARVRRRVAPVPRERLEVAPAVLPVAVDERRRASPTPPTRRCCGRRSRRRSRSGLRRGRRAWPGSSSTARARRSRRPGAPARAPRGRRAPPRGRAARCSSRRSCRPRGGRRRPSPARRRAGCRAPRRRGRRPAA